MTNVHACFDKIQSGYNASASDFTSVVLIRILLVRYHSAHITLLFSLLRMLRVLLDSLENALVKLPSVYLD